MLNNQGSRTMHPPMTRTCLALLSAFSMMACSSQGFELKRAPFTVHDNALLNKDPAPAYPREDRFDPFGVESDWSGARSGGALAARDDRGSQIVDWRPNEALKDDDEAIEPVLVEPSSTAALDADEPPPMAFFDPSLEEKVAPREDKPHDEPPRDAPSPSPQHAADFIRAIYKVNGVDLGAAEGDQAIAALHSAFKRRGRIYHATRPAVGDVIFFHNTFDRNSDRRNNDWYTHIGLVEGVDSDGTIHVLSFREGRVDSFSVNLENPRIARDKASGKVWNTALRAARNDDPAFTQHLAGELFAGFGSLLGDRTELMVIDNWTPGMSVEGL